MIVSQFVPIHEQSANLGFIGDCCGRRLGGLWVAFNFYELSERRAWVLCIREVDQASAANCGVSLPISERLSTLS